VGFQCLRGGTPASEKKTHRLLFDRVNLLLSNPKFDFGMEIEVNTLYSSRGAKTYDVLNPM